MAIGDDIPVSMVGAPAANAERVIFNVKFFRTFTLGDGILEAEIIGLFLDDLPVVKARIMAALDTDDWLDAVHRLRGSALGIGAERLADVARDAEGLGIDEDADRIRALADLSDEIGALVNELSSRGFVAAA